MISKLLVFLFLSLGFLSHSLATPICAKNAKDLDLLKAHFPKFFQDKKEVSFAQIDKRAVAMRFQVTDNLIIAQYDYQFLGTHPFVGYATEICFDKENNELTLAMNNGKRVTTTVTNDDPPHATVTLMGQTLTRNPEVYNKAIQVLGGFEKTLRETFDHRGAQ